MGTWPLSVAPWNFTGWDTTHGDSSGGGVRVCAHTGLLVGVCVRACERQCVLEHSCQSLLHFLQLLVFTQALDFTLLERLESREDGKNK